MGTQPVPMNFRARKPTNHDIAEDVRVTGGIIDVQPEGGVYETTVYLLAGQTIEYGMLGLPVPQIDAQAQATIAIPAAGGRAAGHRVSVAGDGGPHRADILAARFASRAV